MGAEQKLRVGIVGAGGIVLQRHLPGLLKIPGVEIRAIANSSLESSQRFCREHVPDAVPMADWEHLVRLPDIDIVWIGVTPYMHKPITLAALAAGKHVFTQARMTMNLADAREMLAASKAHPHLVTMICPAPVQNAPFIKKLLEEKIAGDLRMIHLRSLNSGYLDASKPAHWRQKKEISGLNIMSLGINIESLQQWFGEIASVQAEGKVFVPQRGGYRVEIPDMLNVLAEFKNGALSVWEFSGVHAGEACDGLEVIGSRGILRCDYRKNSIRLQRPGETAWETLTPPRELVGEWRVEEEFIHAVRHPDEPRPFPTFEDGVAYMAVIQAVSDSRESGRRIAIADL